MAGVLYRSNNKVCMWMEDCRRLWVTTVYIEVIAQHKLQGKQYSTGIRGLKLAQNALTRLFTHSMCHHWPQLKEGKCFQCRRQTIAEWCWSFFCNAEQIVGDVKAWLLNSRGTIPKTFYTKWSNSGIMAENNHRLAPTRIRSCMPQTFCFNCWEQNKKELWTSSQYNSGNNSLETCSRERHVCRISSYLQVYLTWTDWNNNSQHLSASEEWGICHPKMGDGEDHHR